MYYKRCSGHILVKSDSPSPSWVQWTHHPYCHCTLETISCFPQRGERDDIATIGIREEDMKPIPVMYAIVNERIKAQFDENSNADEKSFDIKPDDLSGYLI